MASVDCAKATARRDESPIAQLKLNHICYIYRCNLEGFANIIENKWYNNHIKLNVTIIWQTFKITHAQRRNVTIKSTGSRSLFNLNLCYRLTNTITFNMSQIVLVPQGDTYLPYGNINSCWFVKRFWTVPNLFRLMSAYFVQEVKQL